MSDMFDTLEAEVAGLRRELEAVRAERDTLAAHVERMRDVWQRLHLRSPVHVEVLKAYSHVMRDTPTASLARLKAEWQADALEGCAKGVAACKPGATPRGISIAIKMEAAELRRQAEDSP